MSMKDRQSFKVQKNSNKILQTSHTGVSVTSKQPQALSHIYATSQIQDLDEDFLLVIPKFVNRDPTFLPIT